MSKQLYTPGPLTFDLETKEMLIKMYERDGWRHVVTSTDTYAQGIKTTSSIPWVAYVVAAGEYLVKGTRIAHLTKDLAYEAPEGTI